MDFSPPPSIRNSILEGSDGISAELPWAWTDGLSSFSSAYKSLLMDTECVNKRLVHFAHQNTGMWRAHNQWLWTGQDALAVALSRSQSLFALKNNKKNLCSQFFICKVKIKLWIWKKDSRILNELYWGCLRRYWQEAESTVSFSSYRSHTGSKTNPR